jgi:hypothetical protein
MVASILPTHVAADALTAKDAAVIFNVLVAVREVVLAFTAKYFGLAAAMCRTLAAFQLLAELIIGVGFKRFHT